MAFGAATVQGPLPLRRRGWTNTAALVSAAFALAMAAAAWISAPTQTKALASAALPQGFDRISFEDRFSPLSEPETAVRDHALQPLDRSYLAAVESRVRAARDTLALRLTSGNWRGALLDPAAVDERKPDASPPMTQAGIPLPRSRPATADLESRPALAQADGTAQPEDRTLLQKLSDFLPKPVTLASLTPGGGLFRSGPDLAALGYDSLTAVYDISAQAVYLPSGSKLEAHSGIGSLRDDPEHVDVPNTGATPPAIYDLKPRERLFHGVQALRMIPAEGTTTNGRSGLLTHSYMLGVGGNSNGCVSIKNYETFLKAWKDGEFTRLVVVPSLSGATIAAQHPNTQS